MNKQQILDQAVPVIVESLGVDASDVVLNARFAHDLRADSLDKVELVISFEEAFDIEIPDDDFDAVKTVSDLVDVIYRIKEGS